MWPILIDGVWVCSNGKPWVASPPDPGRRPDGLRRTSPIPRLDPAEAARRTAKSKVYWAAYRAGQEAKREADIPYSPPGWFGARKRREKKRQWLPGEHVNHSKGTKNGTEPG